MLPSTFWAGNVRRGDSAFVERFPASAQPDHLDYIAGTCRLVDSGFRPDERLACAIRRLRLTEPPSSGNLSDWLERTRLVARLKDDPNAAP